MARLIVLFPLLIFFGWIFFKKPTGGIIWLVFFIVVMCTIGLAEMLGLNKEISHKEEKKGDQ